MNLTDLAVHNVVDPHPDDDTAAVYYVPRQDLDDTQQRLEDAVLRDLHQQHRVALIGPPGSGKSSLTACAPSWRQVGCVSGAVAIQLHAEVPMTALADLDPREAAAQLLAEHDDAWAAALADVLARHLAGRRLEQIMRLWQLSRAELGTLFGVSRQAVSRWIADGVPAERARQVADVDAITDLLTRYLKRDRIPAVVRRHAPRLDGMNMIELVTSGRSSEALQLTRQMFTFADLHR